MAIADRTGFNELVTVGGPPESRDVEQLASLGFQCVVDLRRSREGDELGFDDEQTQVEAAGMQYRHLPIPEEPHGLTQPNLVQSVHRGIAEAPAPVYVHDHDGRRSGLLCAMHVAIEEGWPADTVPDRAAGLGFAPESGELRDFMSRYVEEHRRGG